MCDLWRCVTIWALLALVGVPLWLCALGILALVYRNRGLRKRPGDIAVRVQRTGKTRWTRGHAVWVSDVLAWREDLVHVVGASACSATPEERKKLHRLGDGPVVATLTTSQGDVLRVAASAEHRSALSGPFASPIMSNG
jgi:hypothetical protein